MVYKWFGALLIIAGCGGFGFSLAAAHRREENTLRQMISAVNYMACELQYRLTPLPELCRGAGRQCSGLVGTVLTALAGELENQVSPDAGSCMEAALFSAGNLPPSTRENLRTLGQSLGRFDLQGQLNGLEGVREGCKQALAMLENNRDSRLRSYQTLGLCAGAALAILLM